MITANTGVCIHSFDRDSSPSSSSTRARFRRIGRATASLSVSLPSRNNSAGRSRPSSQWSSEAVPCPSPVVADVSPGMLDSPECPEAGEGHNRRKRPMVWSATCRCAMDATRLDVCLSTAANTRRRRVTSASVQSLVPFHGIQYPQVIHGVCLRAQ